MFCNINLRIVSRQEMQSLNEVASTPFRRIFLRMVCPPRETIAMAKHLPEIMYRLLLLLACKRHHHFHVAQACVEAQGGGISTCAPLQSDLLDPTRMLCAPLLTETLTRAIRVLTRSTVLSEECQQTKRNTLPSILSVFSLLARLAKRARSRIFVVSMASCNSRAKSDKKCFRKTDTSTEITAFLDGPPLRAHWRLAAATNFRDHTLTSSASHSRGRFSGRNDSPPSSRALRIMGVKYPRKSHSRSHRRNLPMSPGGDLRAAGTTASRFISPASAGPDVLETS
eukprot:284819701_1